jgi:hypothetical protein
MSDIRMLLYSVSKGMKFNDEARRTWQKTAYFRWNYFSKFFSGEAGNLFISSEYTGSIECLVNNEKKYERIFLVYFELMPQYLFRGTRNNTQTTSFRTWSLWAEIWTWDFTKHWTVLLSLMTTLNGLSNQVLEVLSHGTRVTDDHEIVWLVTM